MVLFSSDELIFLVNGVLNSFIFRDIDTIRIDPMIPSCRN